MTGKALYWGWSWSDWLVGRTYPRHDEGPCGTDQRSRTSPTLVALCSKGMLARGVRSLVQPLRVRAWLTLEEHTTPIFPKVEDSGVAHPFLLLERRTSWGLGRDVWRWCYEGLGALPIER